MSRIPIDPYAKIVDKCYAVVYAPRRKRDRFPADCVEVMPDKQTAIEKANPEEKRYPAIVMGPSRSSEGFRLYYLEQWLDE